MESLKNPLTKLPDIVEFVMSWHKLLLVFEFIKIISKAEHWSAWFFGDDRRRSACMTKTVDLIQNMRRYKSIQFVDAE